MMNKYEPELRFKGFIESWISCKFNDILKTHNYKPFLAKIEEDGEYPIIQQGDKPVVGYSNNKPFQCYRDVTLFGDHTLSLYLPMSPFLIATDGVKILSVDGFEGRFLYTLLEKYLPKSEGYKRHFTILKNNNGYYPEVEERKLLGDFFSKLDNIINYHQQELNTLKQTKQGFLQKMFPKEGGSVPEFRFPDFNEKWEVYKLKEFGKATGGTPIESDFNENGKYKVISIGSYSEDSIYVNQGIRANETKKTKSKVLNKNDLTMILNDKTSSGRIIGRVLLIDKDNSYVYNQRTQRIETNDLKFDAQFLYQLLNSDAIRSKIIRSAQGNTQIYVNWSSIAEMEYLIPSKDEQIQIGKFFKQLDEVITLQQQELEAIKQTKKAFLQKMFV